MVAIADKFGKASVNTDYAIATTVKNIRAANATVLEAFDLSKFATDAPVFFVTYKKTIDPTTNLSKVINQVSWKAIVNVNANTLTNLQLAPGYTDTGNDVGDFIECIPTSHWENSLVDGIFVSHNGDGTLKDNIITTPKIADGAVAPIKIAYNSIPWGILSFSTHGATGGQVFLPNVAATLLFGVLTTDSHVGVTSPSAGILQVAVAGVYQITLNSNCTDAPKSGQASWLEVAPDGVSYRKVSPPSPPANLLFTGRGLTSTATVYLTANSTVKGIYYNDGGNTTRIAADNATDYQMCSLSIVRIA